jgi:hypothetical protein
MTTLLITFAAITARPRLLATAVAVLARDPQRRADACRVVMLLGYSTGRLR